jgi:hypothetical protein
MPIRSTATSGVSVHSKKNGVGRIGQSWLIWMLNWASSQWVCTCCECDGETRARPRMICLPSRRRGEGKHKIARTIRAIAAPMTSAAIPSSATPPAAEAMARPITSKPLHFEKPRVVGTSAMSSARQKCRMPRALRRDGRGC